METLIVHPSSYNPEFVEKILQSDEDIKAGNTTRSLLMMYGNSVLAFIFFWRVYLTK